MRCLVIYVLSFLCVCPALAESPWFESLLQRRAEIRSEQAAARIEAPAVFPDLGGDRYTIAAWVRTDGDGTVWARTAPEGGWVPNGKTLFVHDGRVCYDIGWVGTVTGNVRVDDGEWRHVAFVGAAPQKIFVDGKLDVTGGLERAHDIAGSVFKIGYTSTDYPETPAWTGEIDDVCVFSRALTDEEIAALWRGEEPDAARDSLVAHWRFDGDLEDCAAAAREAAPAGEVRFVEGRSGEALRLADSAWVWVAGPEPGLASRQLWAPVQKTFGDEAARREIDWTRADGIWGFDWAQATPRCIARRYAEATRHEPEAARARSLVGSVHGDSDLKPVHDLYMRSRWNEGFAEILAEEGLSGLRQTIDYVHGSTEVGRRFRKEIDALERTAQVWAEGGIPWGDATEGRRAVENWSRELAELRRAALVAENPLLDFEEILLVKRYTYDSNHYYTEFINSTWKPGGNLCALSLRDGSVREIAPQLSGGVFERFDLSFDGQRIVFAWKGDPQQGYRIYEINTDGSGLRQLTFPPDDEADIQQRYRVTSLYHHGTDDMQPCYLPDGDIAFISTRCQYGILCDPPDNFTTTIMYRMGADGANIRAMTNSSVSEASPVMLPDGRLMYTRWEYVDKGAVSVKCLWAMRPDGSGSHEIYGNDISLPPTFLYGRAIPDAPNRYVMLGTPHCPQNGVGTVIRLDMTRNIRSREPMTYMTPYVDIQAEPGFAFREVGENWRQDSGGHGPLFKDPYPLSENLFLVSHKPAGPPWHDPTAYGLYLLNERGDVQPIHRDPDISCWLPYPLKPRRRPPELAAPADPRLAADDSAACLVTDVYHGLEGVERGAARYIRVLEQAPRPWAARRRWPADDYDQQHVAITKDTHLGLKVQYGVVPIEEDGSAYFVVPAMRNIFLQVLDEDYRALQTERTYVNYMPGETRGCVGCHETQRDLSSAASAPASVVAALRRPPSVPGPQPGEVSGRRPLHYPTDVQPVWDRHCVRCHSGEEPRGGLVLTGEPTAFFSVSYENLVPERRGGNGRRRFELLGPTIGENHPKTGNVHYLPARTLGSHNSVLAAMLTGGEVMPRDPTQADHARRLIAAHKELDLSREELIRVTNWIDTNAQFHGSYWGRRNLRYRDHPNYRPAPTFETAVARVSPLPEEKR